MGRMRRNRYGGRWGRGGRSWGGGGVGASGRSRGGSGRRGGGGWRLVRRGIEAMLLCASSLTQGLITYNSFALSTNNILKGGENGRTSVEAAVVDDPHPDPS